MENAIFHFPLAGAPVSCEKYGFGHINRTFLVVTDQGKRYILQGINGNVFSDVRGMMENIAAVTRFVGEQVKDPRGTLHIVPAEDGDIMYTDEKGQSWRVYDFVEDSICLQAAETREDFFQSAVAFGRFQDMLTRFPAHTLHETIPNIHNTPERYKTFRRVLAADVCGRAAAVRDEIEFALSREQTGGELQRMRDRGELPLRVTHNDTKLNNVMLDAKTRKALCVIDLDTVMPGLAAYDFGDSIRFGAATAAEDEKDLDKMSMDLELYRTFARGFIRSCPSLTEKERETLPLGAKTMTLECGLRFLTDYLDGDHYFAIHRPEHNLDRARTQFKLVRDMEEKWEEMCRIIREETALFKG